jgi:hypothetical protein
MEKNKLIKVNVPPSPKSNQEIQFEKRAIQIYSEESKCLVPGIQR